jgi:hypothetical protein
MQFRIVIKFKIQNSRKDTKDCTPVSKIRQEYSGNLNFELKIAAILIVTYRGNYEKLARGWEELSKRRRKRKKKMMRGFDKSPPRD